MWAKIFWIKQITVNDMKTGVGERAWNNYYNWVNLQGMFWQDLGGYICAFKYFQIFASYFKIQVCICTLSKYALNTIFIYHFSE